MFQPGNHFETTVVSIGTEGPKTKDLRTPGPPLIRVTPPGNTNLCLCDVSSSSKPSCPYSPCYREINDKRSLCRRSEDYGVKLPYIYTESHIKSSTKISLLKINVGFSSYNFFLLHFLFMNKCRVRV